MPEKFLYENEKFLHKVHKHWLIFVVKALGPVFLVIVPPILFSTLSRFSQFGDLASLLAPHMHFVAFAYSVWVLFAWIFMFSLWTDYYLDVWIVTSRRVIDIDQKGFFNREVSSFRLDRIQDITVEVEGWIDTLIKIGTIHVQTAGETRDFVIKGIPNPEKFKEIVYNEHVKLIEDNSFVSPNV